MSALPTAPRCCAACGQPLGEDAQFCSGCGTPAKLTAAGSMVPPATAARRSTSHTVLAVLLAVMGFLGLLVVVLIALQLPAPNSGTTNRPEGTKPTGVEGKQPSIGDVKIGSGRDESGTLLQPGQIVSSSAEILCADIPLLNHPLGGGVLIWIENVTTGHRTAPLSATIEGEGSTMLPLDLPLSDERLIPGKHRLVIVLGEDHRFVKEFEVR